MLKEYLNKTKPYLRNVIIDFQKNGRWKVQSAIAINFISPKDVDEERAMHSKSDKKEFKIYDNASYIVDELLQSLLLRHQIGLETSMK